MYLMNYLFDFAGVDGLFFESPPANKGLRRSKAWLQLDPSAGGSVQEPTETDDLTSFNPEIATWTDLGPMEDGSLYIPSDPTPDKVGRICIRLCPVGALRIGAGGAKLQLAVCFGRPGKAKRRASPFEIKTGVPKTTFIVDAVESNRLDSTGTATSWFFDIGFIKHRPKNKKLHRYEFSVGIVVKDADTPEVHHYSDDPEMDIGE